MRVSFVLRYNVRVNADRAARSELGVPGALAVLSALVIGAFAPSLFAGFIVLDDPQNFVTNPGFRGFSAEHLRWMFGTGHMGNWQPLSWLTYALDHALWGLDGPHFHQASVLWHLLAAAAFFLVAERLLARVPALAGASAGAFVPERRLAALFAALVFAIHPLRAESVAWVTGRNDVIAGLFFLLALLAWLRYTRLHPCPGASAARLAACAFSALLAPVALFFALELPELGLLSFGPWAGAWIAAACAAFAAALLLAPTGTSGGARLAYVLAWLAAVLSLLGKAYGIVLPVLLLILDVWPLARLRGIRASRGGSTFRALAVLVVEKLPFFALSFACSRLTLWAKVVDLRSMGEHSPAERIWQACYGLAFYARKTLLPTGLSAMVDLPSSITLSEPRFLLSLVAVVALTVLLFCWRARAPAALAVWASYGLGIAPSLGLAQSGAQLVADRYSYVACMPFAFAAGGLLALASTRGPSVQRGATAVAVGIVLLLGASTWNAAARWADPIALFEHGIAVSDSPRLMTNLAMTYNEAASEDLAHRTALLERALAWSERAVSTAEARSLLLPRYRLHHGTILLNLGRAEDAARELAWYVERVPDSVEGHLNLGLALLQSDQGARAIESFERCTELAPDLEPAWRGLGAAHDAAGDAERARVSYQRALELAPGNRAVEARLRGLGSR